MMAGRDRRRLCTSARTGVGGGRHRLAGLPCQLLVLSQSAIWTVESSVVKKAGRASPQTRAAECHLLEESCMGSALAPVLLSRPLSAPSSAACFI